MSEEVFYKKHIDGTFVPAGGVYTNEEKRLRKLKGDIEWAKNGFHWEVYKSMLNRLKAIGGHGEEYDSNLREYYRNIVKESLIAVEVYFEEKKVL